MHIVDGDEEAPDDKFTVEDPASPAPATGAESPHEKDKNGWVQCNQEEMK